MVTMVENKMDDGENEDEIVDINIKINLTRGQVMYETVNLPPVQMVFWLEAVKGMVIEDTLMGPG